jgi:hypothetical protein
MISPSAISGGRSGSGWGSSPLPGGLGTPQSPGGDLHLAMLSGLGRVAERVGGM